MSSPNELVSAIVTGGVQNPFPLYDDLRELDHGVHCADELGGWLCTRYDDVRRVYTDHETFSGDYYFDQYRAVYGSVVDNPRVHRQLCEDPTHCTHLGELTLGLVGDLDQVATGVVEHRRGDRSHVGGFLGEAHAESAQPLVLRAHVVDGE